MNKEQMFDELMKILRKNKALIIKHTKHKDLLESLRYAKGEFLEEIMEMDK